MRRTVCFFALTLGLLAIVGPRSTKADELHFADGSIVYGRLESESRLSYKFLEAGKKKAKDFPKQNVARLVLTFALPDFVYTDPKWSKEMVEARKKQVFDPTWGEVEVLRSAHYIVFTNSSAGQRYLETMEDIYEKFKEAFPFEEPKDAPLMPVFLFKTDAQYFEFYSKIAGISIEEAKRTAGHAWRDYYATFYAAPKDPVNYHEGAHQLVGNRLNLHAGGSWFQEGLAVYFEGRIFPGQDPSKGMKSEVRQGKHTSFRDMLSLRSLIHSSQGESLVSRRYRQAGAMIKFFAEGPWKEKFGDFLRASQSGKPWESVFRDVFDRTIEETEQGFVAFYKE